MEEADQRELLTSFLAWVEKTHSYTLMREEYNWVPPYTGAELIEQYLSGEDY